MIVWVLFMVFLVPIPGFGKYNFVHEYTTAEECQTEKIRILPDMRASYPGDTSFTLECHKREKKKPQGE